MVSGAFSTLFSESTDPAAAFLQGLFDHAPVEIAFYDRQSRYVRVNAALATRNGMGAEDHAGRHVREVVPDEAANIERAIERVLASGEAIRIWVGEDTVDYYPVRIAAETIGVGAIAVSGRTAGPAESGRLARGVLDRACILLVDDDDDTRELLAEVVTAAGGAALVAASADEALGVLRSRRADVVVCDIGMPERDGYSFLRELRSSGEAAGGWTPAIALTGYARPEDTQAALLAGFQMHIPKPVDLTVLLDSIVKLWRRGPQANTP